MGFFGFFPHDSKSLVWTGISVAGLIFLLFITDFKNIFHTLWGFFEQLIFFVGQEAILPGFCIQMLYTHYYKKYF